MLDKMCKYEMNPMSIVEDTERTWFCPQMDKRTDGQTDRRTRWYQYTPLSDSLKRGYNETLSTTKNVFEDAICKMASIPFCSETNPLKLSQVIMTNSPCGLVQCWVTKILSTIQWGRIFVLSKLPFSEKNNYLHVHITGSMIINRQWLYHKRCTCVQINKGVWEDPWEMGQEF